MLLRGSLKYCVCVLVLLSFVQLMDRGWAVPLNMEAPLSPLKPLSQKEGELFLDQQTPLHPKNPSLKAFLKDAQKSARKAKELYLGAASFDLKRGFQKETLFSKPSLKSSLEHCGRSNFTQRKASRCPNHWKETSRNPSSESLLIFVSFSMPEDALKALLYQAQEKRDRIIIRGLIDNSWRKTTQKLVELGGVLDIDPEAFKRFGISQVPTFIFKRGQTYDRLRGNVSLSFVREKFKENLRLSKIQKESP